MHRRTERQLLSVRKVAEAVGVAHTTIGRQLAQGLYTNHGTVTRPLLDLDEVRARRDSLLDPIRQAATQSAPHPASEPPAAKTDDALTRGAGAGAPALLQTGLHSEQLRERRAKASMAEMDLLERQQQLAPVGDFKDAGFEAGQALVDALEARIPALVAALAACGSAEQLASAIREHDAQARTAFADALAQQLCERFPRYANDGSDGQPASDLPPPG